MSPDQSIDEILDNVEEGVSTSLKMAIKRLISEFGENSHSTKTISAFLSPIESSYHKNDIIRNIESIHGAYTEVRKREIELSFMLTSARAILNYREFEDVVLAIFESCKNLLGANAGYVAIVSDDGNYIEPLFLNHNKYPFVTLDRKPVPLKGSCKEVVHSGKTFYQNSDYEINWFDLRSGEKIHFANVLIDPFIIDGKTAGLLCIAGKESGFTEYDTAIISAFGELASTALSNCLMLDSLESSEKLFRSVVQTAHDAIICVSGKGTIVFWNIGAENIFGYTVTEILGRNIDEMIPKLVPDLNLLADEREGRTYPLPKRTVEKEGITKDKISISVELSVTSLQSKTSGNEDLLFTVIIRDISERKMLAEMVRDYTQKLELRVEEKITELLEKQQQMLHQERLAMLGRLSSSVGHDINNPLQYVKGNAELLMEMIEEGETDVREFIPLVNSILKGSDKIEQTSKRLRRVSRKGSFKKPFNLIVAVNIAIVMTKVRWKKTCETISIRYTDPPEMITDHELLVNGNESDITHVFMNLLVNAAQAIESKGHIWVNVYMAGKNVVVEVEDTGHGIPPEIIKKIGKVAVTTKSVEEGTGLGLIGAFEIINEHGGKIEAGNSTNGGALFKVLLPLYREGEKNSE